jgi:hypothetical protein
MADWYSAATGKPQRPGGNVASQTAAAVALLAGGSVTGVMAASCGWRATGENVIDTLL